MPSETSATWANIGRVATLESTGAGPFRCLTVTGEMLDDILGNAKLPLYVDYDFDWLRAEKPGAKPAAGMIHEVARFGDRLWAHVELSPNAAELITARRYTHCVMAIEIGAMDRVTGEPIGTRLMQAALTNDPLDTQLYPIQFGQEPVS